MSELNVSFSDNKREFQPGERLEGMAGWSLDGHPESVEVRLLWHTKGRGSKDLEIVDTFTIADPRQEQEEPFQFNLPQSPYSFSGQLISLIWTVELVIEPGSESTHLDFTLSPTGREILLPLDSEFENESPDDARQG
jgi:hypothetical protein